MPIFSIRLTRHVLEVATIAVDADSEVNAINIAFKEIDRTKDVPADKRVQSVSIVLAPIGDNIWEEE